ncbi:thiamine pyrophosphate-dependent dehydrogenase E1 component subunit alpha [bacterium]|nr:thiamine pyrophosphate-dependent dehydrogenase E1 component subunit alpha [bacterium]
MPEISDADLKALYRTMVMTRVFDQRMITLQRQGRLGFYLGSLGEEAASVGSAFALWAEDWIFPCYREQGAYLWRGVTVQEMAHQCYGNGLDYTKGRQMPVHYSFRHKNIVSISSPLTVQLPQAVGAAWAAKLRKDPIITLTYLGEGASSQGDFHVGLNFAGVYKTPTVFFLRNNGWAISTPREVQTASENFAMKANAYGFEGVLVDGNDLLAVIVATKRAADKARSGGGPTLIEAVTYRVGGHSTSDDPSVYRKDEEVKAWEAKDPIARFQRFLAKKGLWTPEWELEIQEACKAEVLAAAEAAEKAPAPAPETIFDDVFSDIPRFLQEQRAELMDSLQQSKEAR